MAQSREERPRSDLETPPPPPDPHIPKARGWRAPMPEPPEAAATTRGATLLCACGTGANQATPSLAPLTKGPFRGTPRPGCRKGRGSEASRADKRSPRRQPNLARRQHRRPPSFHGAAGQGSRPGLSEDWRMELEAEPLPAGAWPPPGPRSPLPPCSKEVGARNLGALPPEEKVGQRTQEHLSLQCHVEGQKLSVPGRHSPPAPSP